MILASIFDYVIAGHPHRNFQLTMRGDRQQATPFGPAWEAGLEIALAGNGAKRL